MRAPISSAVSSSGQAPLRPPKPKKRGLLYALGGCGCVLLSIVIGALVIIIASAALTINAASDLDKMGTTTILAAPTKPRAKKAKKAAERVLDNYEKGAPEEIWKLAAPGLREVLGDHSSIKARRDELQQVGKYKKRYLIDQGTDLLRGKNGSLIGTQKFVYEYRSGKERRVYECTVWVQDSKIIGDKHGPPASEDFLFVSDNCSRKTVKFRKSWGDKPTKEVLAFGGAMRELTQDGWARYSFPSGYEKGTELIAKKWLKALFRGDYKGASALFSPEMKKQLPTKGLKAFDEVVRLADLKKFEISAYEWVAAPTFDAWLSGSEHLGTTSVRASAPIKGNKILEFDFKVYGPYRKPNTAGKAANTLEISKLKVTIIDAN